MTELANKFRFSFRFSITRFKFRFQGSRTETEQKPNDDPKIEIQTVKNRIENL